MQTSSVTRYIEIGRKRRTHGANVIESFERSLLSVHRFSWNSRLLNGGTWSQYRIVPTPAKKCGQSGRHLYALLTWRVPAVSVADRQAQVYSITVCHATQLYEWRAVRCSVNLTARVLRKSRFYDNFFCKELLYRIPRKSDTRLSHLYWVAEELTVEWGIYIGIHFYFVENAYCILMSRVLSKACHVHAMHYVSWSDMSNVSCIVPSNRWHSLCCDKIRRLTAAL